MLRSRFAEKIHFAEKLRPVAVESFTKAAEHFEIFLSALTRIVFARIRAADPCMF